MAGQIELPLPEISTDNFSRGWLRFQLVAKAKGWDEDQQKTILPTLLRGDLLDAYLGISDEERASLNTMKEALAKRAGVTKHPLLMCKLFSEKCQGAHQRVLEYATELTKLFKEAYPSEEATSGVLLQRFLAGLNPSISQQVLLKGQPSSLEEAVKTATEVESVLQFGRSQQQEEMPLVCALQDQQRVQQETIEKLTTTMEQLMKRLDETRQARQDPRHANQDHRSGQDRRPRYRRRLDIRNVQCFRCHEYGHYQYQCPLNGSSQSQRRVGTDCAIHYRPSPKYNLFYYSKYQQDSNPVSD